jgi:hypothetical protein
MNRLTSTAARMKLPTQPVGRWNVTENAAVKANLANWDSGHQESGPKELKELNKRDTTPDDEFDEMIFLMILHGKCF